MDSNKFNKQSKSNSRKNKSSKRSKSHVLLGKIVLIIPVILIFLGLSKGFLFPNINLPKIIPSKSTQEDHDKTPDNQTTYFLDSLVPDCIFRDIESLAQKYDWKKEQENTADIRILFNPDTEQEKEYYQFLVVTKPWSLLSEEFDTIPIEEVSNKIDPTSAKVIFRDLNYDFSENSNYQTRLLTIQDLNLSEIPIEIDDLSPLDPYWWINKNYPLTITIGLSGDSDLIDLVDEELAQTLTDNDFFPEYISADKFLTIVKTGTSVAGGPGWQLCEQSHGVSYPIQEIKEFLNKADLTIISNESSFLEGCQQGNGTTAFCGKPSYLQNLLDINTSIISLTGNHMSDYGRTAFVNTMKTYSDNDIKFFASGSNLENAWSPLIIETLAGNLAFIGFNKMGPGGVLATETLAGTAYFDESKLESAILEAKENADVIWVDTHLWPEYGTTATDEQIEISRMAIDFGADIVTGVSSHEIQAMEFYQDKAIFWGLGNFLFDQMWSTETRQGLVLKIYIYDSTIKQIEIKPTVLYDYCQPRFAESDQKTQLLQYFSEISEF